MLRQAKTLQALGELGTALSEFRKFEQETFGGRVVRSVTRTPFDTAIQPVIIDENLARFECSGWAIVADGKGSEFEKIEGAQIRYLLTLDEMFLFPSLVGAFGELLDAGCEIRTKKASYRLAGREVC